MEGNKKMNILVLGNSGAGKSTLIRAISGAAVATGVGEGHTQKIDVYSSDTWPMNFIDTKGFEHSYIEQKKTISQIKKFTKEHVKSDAESDDVVGIDAVWYCVEGTARRVFTHNIDTMNKSIRGWKNIPVFVVITKSYSEQDKETNIQAVKAAFAKSNKPVNLRKIIPVVAEAYPINEDVIVPPQGIDELCNATLECFSEAKMISDGNRMRMIREQRRGMAQTLVGGSSAAAVVIGAVPVPFADSALLVPLETAMTKGLFKVYHIDFSKDLITGVIGSAAITTIAKAVLSQLKTIPNIAASVLNAVVAGFFVASLGEAIIALCEAVCSGKVDIEKIDQAIDFLSAKMKENPALGLVVKYLEKNASILQGKTAKEIFKVVNRAIESGSKNNK